MKVQRKTAVGMDSLMIRYVKAMGISASHNTHRIYLAWEEASGAAANTIKRYFKDGTLTITLNSSVVRSVLLLQTDLLIFIEQPAASASMQSKPALCLVFIYFSSGFPSPTINFINLPFNFNYNTN